MGWCFQQNALETSKTIKSLVKIICISVTMGSSYFAIIVTIWEANAKISRTKMRCGEAEVKRFADVYLPIIIYNIIV